MEEYKENETAKAFRLFGEKLADPKHVGRNTVQVFAEVCSEVAHEMDNYDR